MIKRFLLVMCMVLIGMIGYRVDHVNKLSNSELLGNYLDIVYNNPNDEENYIEGNITYEFIGMDKEYPEYMEYNVYENDELKFKGVLHKRYAKSIVIRGWY